MHSYPMLLTGALLETPAQLVGFSVDVVVDMLVVVDANIVELVLAAVDDVAAVPFDVVVVDVVVVDVLVVDVT